MFELKYMMIEYFHVLGWCTFNNFVIYHFDGKYQCLLISYPIPTKQEQQQPVMDFENVAIVKIYVS